MSEISVASERPADRLSLCALVAGAAAIVAYGLAPFTAEVLSPIELALAGVGGILGFIAIRRTNRGERSRTIAVVGLAASAIVIVWFLIYLIVIAFD